jgi:hypothetical protein
MELSGQLESMETAAYDNRDLHNLLVLRVIVVTRPVRTRLECYLPSATAFNDMLS